MAHPPGDGRKIGRRSLLRAAGVAGAAGVGAAALSSDRADSARLTSVNATSVAEYGASGDGTNDDRDAIQAALEAAGEKGGAVFFPPGDYLVGGPLRPRSKTVLFGSHTPRWIGGMNPSSACKIRMSSGFSGGEGLVEPPGDTWGVTLRNLALVGDGSGSNLHGLRLPDLRDFAGNESWLIDGVTIAGFSGSGIVGCAQTTTIVNSMVHDNVGWGIDATGGNRWTDCHLSNCFFFYNRLGNVHFGGPETSGFVEFANCRFERAGTNPTDIFRPYTPAAPGVRLTNARYMHFVNCTTDANCGNGFEVEATEGQPEFLPAFIGLTNCHLSRDGTGDNRDQGDYAALKVLGAGPAPANQPREVKCVNCFVTYGKADDTGAGKVVGPKYGVWFEHTGAFQWLGGHISVLPPGGEYRTGKGVNSQPTLLDLAHGLLTLPLKAPDPAVSAPPGAMYFDDESGRLYVRSGDGWKSVRLN